MSSIYDWSTTPASNITVDGVGINTGCAAGNIDNALRSIMALVRSTFHADLQTFLAGSAPLPVANGGTGLTSTAGLYVPAGAVFHFAMPSVPTGYLECNGAAVSRSTYATLFAAIGTWFGAGNGSTTFNVPDLRGEFIRGYDNGRGADTGRTFASTQTDAVEIAGTFQTIEANGVVATGAFSQAIAGAASISGGAANFSHVNITLNGGGTETRPRNIAMLPCIKY